MRLNSKVSPLDQLIHQHYREVHGLRMALAFVLAFGIIRFHHFADGTWLLITMVAVIGPMSYLGNVAIRAAQRLAGTVIGSVSGLIALQIEIYSFPLMLVWCAIVMFVCGYMAIGKRSYVGILIGITLCVITASPQGDMDSAWVRCIEVFSGCMIALIFTSIYPQRAFIHWRLLMSKTLKSIGDAYNATISPNAQTRPQIDSQRKAIQSNLAQAGTLTAPAENETRLDKQLFDSINKKVSMLLASLNLLSDAYWATDKSHSVMVNAPKLSEFQQMTISSIHFLSDMLLNGNIEDNFSNVKETDQLLDELKQAQEQIDNQLEIEASIFGYIWLSMEITKGLDELQTLVKQSMSKPHRVKQQKVK